MENLRPQPRDPVWTRSPEELAGHVQTDLARGLSQEDARERLARDGPNVLPEAPPPSALWLLLTQFSSLIVWVLIGAAIVSGLLEDWVDAAAILAIVLLNGVLGFVQEYRAERSLAALRTLSISMARVVRDGVTLTIPAREVVRGDLVQLEAGDRIPADVRLTYVTNFQTQEASLTGESTPVGKCGEALTGLERSIADRTNMAFMGTVAISGKAHALVVSTGVQTELGQIAAMIQQATEAERTDTPLQRRLERFGVTLLWLALSVVMVVFFLGALRGEPIVTMFLTAVSLAVAAIPEGLPAVVTITLAMGVTRMVKRHALVRRLPAVETLGSASVICTDKTGTLTKNEMTVTHLFAGERAFTVTGEGYDPVGTFGSTEGPVRELPAAAEQLLVAGVLCNGAVLRQEEGSWRIVGDPTEGALLVAAVKGRVDRARLEATHRFLGEVPFDPERKMMSVVRDTPHGPTSYVKGAPDVLLQHCSAHMASGGEIEPLTEAHRARYLAANAQYAQQALRVLGLAYRRDDRVPASYRPQDVERDLVLLGLVAMKDPLRVEAKAAVRLCRDAGIRTVMITGDHKDTAIAIAEELELHQAGIRALSGLELERLSPEALAAQVREVSVYARVSAEHKLRIVNAWKASGAVVAMTGDGVNDAPAIKAADIGVAMGITGTDVSKEAADMVVTDDNFASIAAAVEEGRGIFDNIRKTVHFLLSCNVSEVLMMLCATLVGLPLPLLPIHILWMNLVTDGLPALALAMDPRDPELMQRQPRAAEAPLLDRHRLLAIGEQGLMLSLIALMAFSLSLYVWQQELEQARTVAFTVMVLAQLTHAFNCRSERLSLLRLGIGTNRPLVLACGASLVVQVLLLTMPFTQTLFKIVPLPLEDWALMAVMGLMPWLLVEARKAFARRATRDHKSVIQP